MCDIKYLHLPSNLVNLISSLSDTSVDLKLSVIDTFKSKKLYV